MMGSDWVRTSSMAVLLAALAGIASAQSTDLEPGVQTSPGPSGPPAPAPTTAPPAGIAAPATAAAPVTSAKPATSATATRQSARSAARAGGPPAAADAGSKPGGKSQDRIELDTTQISGNRELPKVMYVVPWRKADLGEFAGRPPNSLLDEALTPVDRDVFRRQNRYYSALEAGSGASKSQPDAAAGKTAAPEAKDEK